MHGMHAYVLVGHGLPQSFVLFFSQMLFSGSPWMSTRDYLPAIPHCYQHRLKSLFNNYWEFFVVFLTSLVLYTRSLNNFYATPILPVLQPRLLWQADNRAQPAALPIIGLYWVPSTGRTDTNVNAVGLTRSSIESGTYTEPLVQRHSRRFESKMSLLVVSPSQVSIL